MPAEAGNQSALDINKFKALDSRSRLKACRDKLRGNDGVFAIAAQSLKGEGIYFFHSHILLTFNF